jgi:hypothetical protein
MQRIEPQLMAALGRTPHPTTVSIVSIVSRPSRVGPCWVDRLTMLTIPTIELRIFQLDVAFAGFAFAGAGYGDALAAQDRVDAAQLA